MTSRVVKAEELNAVLEALQPKLAAADQDELRGVGGDESVSERCRSPVPPLIHPHSCAVSPTGYGFHG